MNLQIYSNPTSELSYHKPMVQNHVLLVEDSPEYQLIIEKAMSFKYKLDVANSLAEARTKIANRNYALILLDVMLPDGDGFDLFRELREQLELTNTPVVFLTAKTSITDKYAGFSLGADDYITKPFDTTELLLRVDWRIVKSQRNKYLSENIKRGALHLEVQNMCVYLEGDGTKRQVAMTPIEFKLLLKLVQNDQIVFSRQQLLDSVWTQDVFIEDRSIDKHISSIRKKIRPYDEYIKTVSGIGYKFQI
jgi:DNA-binding response OmpR family regulator